ncbi:hypothetical protein CVIRNUC_009738 [Coccomyxa viridis]|uniref:Alcohol dehydrogenase-like N-terminal domain-containing protein n=1 Tax=Coccomyxa viridis TaxID=1274662 RepID=A0AAV1IJY4_9CHLO|nr:hypothetical protein CVIRNUC_009738 [Coccomyxa viridis]
MEMRAAVLQKDRSVTIKSVPVPKLLPRSVRVKVLAVQMAPYTTDVVSGKLGYRHGEPPVILGCSGVGEVLEVAEDVHDVEPGDIVFCDPMVGNPSNQGHYDWILQGWTALSPESMLTQKKYPSGTLAEQYVTPAECLTRIDRPEMQPMARWSTLIWFSIAQGALTRGSIQAGQVVAVTGATGGLGSCAVLLALAAGASKACVGPLRSVRS